MIFPTPPHDSREGGCFSRNRRVSRECETLVSLKPSIGLVLSKKESGIPQQLELALLRMQGGDLLELGRSERASIIEPLCAPGEVEKFIRTSYRQIGVLSRIDPKVLADFQIAVSEDGRAIGQNLIARGHPEVLWLPHDFHPDAPKGMFAKQTVDEINAEIESYVKKRVGGYRGYSLGSWHFINFVIFMGWLGANGVGSEELSSWLQIAWLLSLGAMIFPLWRMYLSSDALVSKKGFTKQWLLFERPIREGIESVLNQAMSERTDESPDWNAIKAYRSRAYKRGVRQASTSKRAEEMCANWLRSIGQNAQTTADGPDGGVDIRSFQYLGQVKNYKGSVPVQAVREIFGLATSEGKEAIFFTSGNYTKAAIDFANKVDMPLMKYDGLLEEFEGANRAGQRLL